MEDKPTYTAGEVPCLECGVPEDAREQIEALWRERDALAAQCNELQHAAHKVLASTAAHGQFDAMALILALGELAMLLQRAPAASLAAHDAAVWREAAQRLLSASFECHKAAREYKSPESEYSVAQGMALSSIALEFERRAAELEAQA